MHQHLPLHPTPMPRPGEYEPIDGVEPFPLGGGKWAFAIEPRVMAKDGDSGLGVGAVPRRAGKGKGGRERYLI
jgi:hypothetical protein